jgi:hypothetical protein
MSIEENDDPNFLTVIKSGFLYFASKRFATKAFVEMMVNVRCRTEQAANDSFLRCEPSSKDSKTKLVRSAETLFEDHRRKENKTEETPKHPRRR